MKRSFSYFFLTAIVLTLGFGLSAQTNEKMTKEQKKQERLAHEAANWKLFNSLAQEKLFVIEISSAGNNNSLSPRLNFLYVNQDSAVFQLQSYSQMSNNGLGGFTINGTISNYQYIPPKKKSKPIYIQFNLQSKNRARGMLNINITVYGDGQCNIDMGANANLLQGSFMSPEKSKVLVGTDISN